MKDTVQAKRLKLALGVVCLIIGGVCASGKLIAVLTDNEDSSSMNVKTAWSSLMTDSDTPNNTVKLSESFNQEVFDPEIFSSVQVSKEGGTVGFFSQEGPQATFSLCSDLLAEKGWNEVPSGYGSAASFVKETGEYTWLFISCMTVDDETAVVVQFG